MFIRLYQEAHSVAQDKAHFSLPPEPMSHVASPGSIQQPQRRDIKSVCTDPLTAKKTSAWLLLAMFDHFFFLAFFVLLVLLW
jgi:hypothetical protein